MFNKVIKLCDILCGLMCIGWGIALWAIFPKDAVIPLAGIMFILIGIAFSLTVPAK